MRRLVGFPPELTSFVGRSHELAEAKRLLLGGSLLTLTGMGGVGKTRLARQVARQVSGAFPDGVWLVSLTTVQDGRFASYVVADALGFHDDKARPPLPALIEHLRERRLLLLLDGCERLIGSCASLVLTIMREAAGIRVLATSRHRLGVTGEHPLNVASLCVPTPKELGREAAAVRRFPVLRLFADRAAAVGFEVTANELEVVATLCRRLNGLPLAIELAAARMQTVSPDQLIELLGDRYGPPTGGRQGRPRRHRTLRATVDWSYDLCTPREQRTWARLSAFGGSFDLAAAEAVCRDNDTGCTDVIEAVTGLVDKSILVSEGDGAWIRYRLVASLRDYGLDKLSLFGDAVEVRRRHRDHYLRLAGECEQQWFGPRQAALADRLRAERDNFRVALDFCLTAPGEAQHTLELAGRLWCYWASYGTWSEALYWLSEAVRKGARPNRPRMKAHWSCGALVLIHSRSTAVLMAGGPPGTPARLCGKPPPVTPVADHIPAVQRSDPELLSLIVLSQVELACTLVFHGWPRRAVSVCTEALAVCERHGDEWARSYVLRTLAMACWSLGELDRAAEHARACLRLEYVRREKQGLARTIELLAAIAASAGDFERAAVLHGAADSVWRETGYNPAAWHARAGRKSMTELRAREALGESGFAKAFRRGTRLSSADLISGLVVSVQQG